MIERETTQDLAKSEVEVNVREKGSKFGFQKKVSYLVTVFISLTSTVLGIFTYHKFFVPKIAVFDLPGYVIGLRNLYLTKQISEEELKKKIDEAIGVVQTYASDYVIFSSDVVLGRNKKVKVIPLPQLPASSQKSVDELMKEYFKRERGFESTR